MDEGQKKKHIGRGMKPRGDERVTPPKEIKAMTQQSTTEGQKAPAKEPVLEPQEGNETPGTLEPENGDKLLQNLDSKKATVAHDEGLEAALNESGDVIDAEFEEVLECSGQVIGAIPTADEMEGVLINVPGVAPKPQPPCSGATHPFLGLQPDGSTKVIVAIPEGVFEPVNELAKDRGISVERWCDEFFNESLDAYFSPAGKR